MMTESVMLEIASAIERGIVGQANFLASLSTAIFGGMVAFRLQFRLSSSAARQVRWTWAFWLATVFAVPTIGLPFAISGMLIEVAPVLFSFPFDTTKELAAQDFSGTRMEDVQTYSKMQVFTFIPLAIFAGTFILKNVAGNSK